MHTSSSMRLPLDMKSCSQFRKMKMKKYAKVWIGRFHFSSSRHTCKDKQHHPGDGLTSITAKWVFQAAVASHNDTSASHKITFLLHMWMKSKWRTPKSPSVLTLTLKLRRESSVRFQYMFTTTSHTRALKVFLCNGCGLGNKMMGVCKTNSRMKAVNTLVLGYNGEATRKQAASIKCLLNFVIRHVVLNLSRPGPSLIHPAWYHLIPHMLNAFYHFFFQTEPVWLIYFFYY